MSSLKKIIKQVLYEIRIEPKKKFKSGSEHAIYQSKQNPDRLFKVGNEKLLDWVKIFRDNPNIFAKVYRVGKTSGDRYFAEVEKLNTDRVEKEWQQMEDKLEEIGVIDLEDGEYARDIADLYMSHGNNPKTISEIATKLKSYDFETYKLFMRYFKLFNECEKSIEKIIGHETVLDAHRYNFGYDSDGKLKCLDM